VPQHEHGHEQRAAHEHERLDDLDVGRALHPAHGHINDHQCADEDDRGDLRRGGVHAEERGVRADAQQQGHQRAGPDHLGQQVEDRHRHGGDGGGRTDRTLPHPERQNVGHRVAARVAQQFGDEQQRHQPRDQEADRVQEPVVAVERDEAGDAEERRRRHVVAADRHAVLEAGEAATAGVEVGRVARLPTGPERDGQRHDDEREEQRDGDAPLRARVDRREISHRDTSGPVTSLRAATSRRISSASGSMRRWEKRS
jgi:hypothetical protein